MSWATVWWMAVLGPRTEVLAGGGLAAESVVALLRRQLGVAVRMPRRDQPRCHKPQDLSPKSPSRSRVNAAKQMCQTLQNFLESERTCRVVEELEEAEALGDGGDEGRDVLRGVGVGHRGHGAPLQAGEVHAARDNPGPRSKRSALQTSATNPRQDCLMLCYDPAYTSSL